MVVVAEDRRDAVARRQIGEAASDERREPRVVVDDVAGHDDEIGPRLADEVQARVEIALGEVDSDVQIADLDDDVPVERARQAGNTHGDLARPEGVPAVDRAPPEHGAGGGHRADSGGPLDYLSARHRGASRRLLGLRLRRRSGRRGRCRGATRDGPHRDTDCRGDDEVDQDGDRGDLQRHQDDRADGVDPLGPVEVFR